MPQSRRHFLALAGALPSAFAAPPAAARIGAPLKITDIETFVVRFPPGEGRPEDYFVQMTPMGATTGGVGLWDRLERSETVRQKGYQQTLLVRVSTDQGVQGWGEAHAVTAPRVAKTVISDLLRPILLGQDARNIEALWEKMYSTERLRGYGSGYFTRAIAGIDIALWDIVGKASGLPVWQLLGGKFRDRVPTYAALGGNSISQLKENASKLLSAGYTVMKMGLSKAGQQTSDINRVAAASEVIGGKGQVLVDSLGAYALHEATVRGRELDRLGNVGWWEDVLPPEDMDGYARLAEALDVPICAGEQYSNRYQFRDLFRLRAVDITNPDVARMGLTEARRVAVLADVHNVLLSPHCSMGTAPYRAASIHLSAASANAVILEGGESYLGPLGNRLLKQPLGYRPGSVDVPDSPGLGVEFDATELKKVIGG